MPADKRQNTDAPFFLSLARAFFLLFWLVEMPMPKHFSFFLLLLVSAVIAEKYQKKRRTNVVINNNDDDNDKSKFTTRINFLLSDAKIRSK